MEKIKVLTRWGKEIPVRITEARLRWLAEAAARGGIAAVLERLGLLAGEPLRPAEMQPPEAQALIQRALEAGRFAPSRRTLGQTRIARLLEIARATQKDWALVISRVDGRKSIVASPDGRLTHMLEQTESGWGPYEVTWEHVVHLEEAEKIAGRWTTLQLIPLDQLFIGVTFDAEGRIVPLRWGDVT